MRRASFLIHLSSQHNFFSDRLLDWSRSALVYMYMLTEYIVRSPPHIIEFFTFVWVLSLSFQLNNANSNLEKSIFLEEKEVFTWEKSSIPIGFFWYTNMTAISFMVQFVHKYSRRYRVWKLSIAAAYLPSWLSSFVKWSWLRSGKGWDYKFASTPNFSERNKPFSKIP